MEHLDCSFVDRKYLTSKYMLTYTALIRYLKKIGIRGTYDRHGRKYLYTKEDEEKLQASLETDYADKLGVGTTHELISAKQALKLLLKNGWGRRYTNGALIRRIYSKYPKVKTQLGMRFRKGDFDKKLNPIHLPVKEQLKALGITRYQFNKLRKHDPEKLNEMLSKLQLVG